MMLISIRWKISIHASGITGPVTVLTYSLGVVGLFLFGLTVPVGWARIRLGVHTLSQVVAGALLTIATTWLQLRIYLTLL
jgi:membrane-associated phospholipid phosphatase